MISRRLVIFLVSAAVVAAAGACTHRVKVDPVKIDITARVDIYQHAGDIEDMVSGEKPMPGADEAEDDGKTGLNIGLMSGVAYAADVATRSVVRLKEMTPGVAARIKSRKARHAAVEAAKKDRAVGESNLGLLAERPNKRISSDESYRKKIRDLVSAENDDRSFIYREIARQNGTPPERADETGKVFAQVHREKAADGEWIQLPGTEEGVKEFSASPLGRLFLGKLKPGQWVKKAG